MSGDPARFGTENGDFLVEVDVNSLAVTLGRDVVVRRDGRTLWLFSPHVRVVMGLGPNATMTTAEGGTVNVRDAVAQLVDGSATR